MTDPARLRRLAAVHLAAKDLALTEFSYRDVLETVTGKRSAADCSDAELARVLDHFKALGWSPKRPGHRGRPRSRGANAAQGAKARALWRALWNLAEIGNPDEAALAAFVKRQAKVDSVDWVTPAQANAVIEALKSWCGRAGFEVPDDGLAARRALLRAQWRRLGELGALRVKDEAALDRWLTWKVTPHQSSVDLLDARQCDAAADKLGSWLRRARRGAEAGHA